MMPPEVWHVGSSGVLAAVAGRMVAERAEPGGILPPTGCESRDVRLVEAAAGADGEQGAWTGAASHTYRLRRSSAASIARVTGRSAYPARLGAGADRFAKAFRALREQFIYGAWMGCGQSVGAGLLVVGGGCCGVVDSGSRKTVSPRWGLWVVRGAFPGLTPPGYWLSPRWGLSVVGGFCCGVVDSGSREIVSPRWGLWACAWDVPGAYAPGFYERRCFVKRLGERTQSSIRAGREAAAPVGFFEGW